MIPLLFAGILSFEFFKKIQYCLLVIICVFATVLLLLTNARAAIIGSIFGCLVVIWPIIKSSFKKNKTAYLLISIVALGFIFTQLYKIKPKSALGRLTIYRISLNILHDNLWFGVGPNRFSAVYNNYQSNFFKEEKSSIKTQVQADNTYEAFNSIIQILVEYGLIGFILFLLLMIQSIRYINNNKDLTNDSWLLIGSKGSLLAIILASLFSNPFHVTPILLIICFHLSIVFPSYEIVDQNKKNLIVRIAFPLIIIGCIGYYTFFQYKAESLWDKAHDLAIYDDYENAKVLYEKAYPYLKYNGDFLFNYGAETALAKEYGSAIDLLTQSARYNSTSNIFLYLGDCYAAVNDFYHSESSYIRSIYITPSHVYPKYQLIQLYKKFGKIDKMKIWINKTLQMPIKVQSAFVDELITDLKKNR